LGVAIGEAARVIWLHELWNGTDEQFKRQVKRAQECRELQDKLVAAQPLTRWAIRPAKGGDRADPSLMQFCNTSTDGDR
jgi:hypothetical protein